ncbi:hypothetical protein GYMLUDRAFT_241093 [Collybiopsis luxurians FD-317 M1]|nr:hypothetical protein GYMLUDRAFT_241093 [Collybiopsis luxurians FD-317 M1]
MANPYSHMPSSFGYAVPAGIPLQLPWSGYPVLSAPGPQSQMQQPAFHHQYPIPFASHNQAQFLQTNQTQIHGAQTSGIPGYAPQYAVPYTVPLGVTTSFSPMPYYPLMSRPSQMGLSDPSSAIHANSAQITLAANVTMQGDQATNDDSLGWPNGDQHRELQKGDPHEKPSSRANGFGFLLVVLLSKVLLVRSRNV